MPEDYMRLAGLNRDQTADVAGAAVLVLPIGATEQHGPGLPLATDFALVTRVAAAACEETSAPAILAPTLPYGNSVHHLFACAASLSSTTLQRVLADLIDSFVVSGFRRIVVVNGHGGNDECAKLAVKDAVNRHAIIAAAVNYWSLAPVDETLGFAVPGHAGAFEASLLLATRPDLLAAAPDTEPSAALTEDFGRDVVVARSGDWAASGGFTDNPARADAHVGQRLFDSITTELARLLDRVAMLPTHLQPPKE